MESGFEEQINVFLEKFKATSAQAAIEDELLFDSSGGMIRTRSKFDMEYDGIEMTGKGGDNLISAICKM